MKAIANTFVLVAPDCPAAAGTVPSSRRPAGPSVAAIQHELLTARPYSYTLEGLMVATHARRLGLSAAEAEARDGAIRAELFARPYPCMRASALAKRHGWGVHHDAEGRMALVGVESAEYRRLASGAEPGVAVVVALRTRRAS